MERDWRVMVGSMGATFLLRMGSAGGQRYLDRDNGRPGTVSREASISRAKGVRHDICVKGLPREGEGGEKKKVTSSRRDFQPFLSNGGERSEKFLRNASHDNTPTRRHLDRRDADFRIPVTEKVNATWSWVSREAGSWCCRLHLLSGATQAASRTTAASLEAFLLLGRVGGTLP